MTIKTTSGHTTYLTAYKFNGKEMDAETGLYYYGARYYEPELAMWYGVDALAEKYASMGGYVYCAGNPVKLVDPDGNIVRVFTDKSMLPHSFISVEIDGKLHVYTYGQYGQQGHGWDGTGAMVHLVDQDAIQYIQHEFEEYGDNMSVYEIQEGDVNDNKIYSIGIALWKISQKQLIIRNMHKHMCMIMEVILKVVPSN